jgi:iron complex transport system permease protein
MISLTRGKYFGSLAVCVLLLGGALWLSPGIGTTSKDVGLSRVWSAWAAPGSDPIAYKIGFDLRLPRSVLAMVAGMTLALCGAVFQVLFRNALATPYTLGIASGGSLGALVAIIYGFHFSFLGLSPVAVCALAGSLAVVAVVLAMTRGARRLSSNELLLAGVTMGLFCSAMMMVVLSLASARQTLSIVRWTLGSLDTVGHAPLATILPLVLPAWVGLLLCARGLNQYALGDTLAASRGVHVVRLQVTCVLLSSLAVAGVVSICGPIGFVGLVVPHVVRMIFGEDCRLLLPASAMLGGFFLIVCDWMSQLIPVLYGAVTGTRLGGVTLNIGAVTAVVGVPFFLILLRMRRTRS